MGHEKCNPYVIKNVLIPKSIIFTFQLDLLEPCDTSKAT